VIGTLRPKVVPTPLTASRFVDLFRMHWRVSATNSTPSVDDHPIPDLIQPIVRQLGLDPKQEAAIRTLEEEFAASVQEYLREADSEGTLDPLTMQNEIQQRRVVVDAKIDEILTPDQRKKRDEAQRAIIQALNEDRVAFEREATELMGKTITQEALTMLALEGDRAGASREAPERARPAAPRRGSSAPRVSNRRRCPGGP